nr:hypothetical protein [Tanacetum cinerariifolium]
MLPTFRSTRSPTPLSPTRYFHPAATTMSPPPLIPSQSTIATAIHHDTANIIIVTPQQPPPQPPPVHHSTTTPPLLPRIIPPRRLSRPWQQPSPQQQERGCLFGGSAAGVFVFDLLNKGCLFLGLLTVDNDVDND